MDTQRIKRRMAIATMLLACLGIPVAAHADQTIGTSSGQFRLTDSGDLQNLAAIHSAERVADLAIAAALSNAKRAADDAKQSAAQLAALKPTQDQLLAEVTQFKSALDEHNKTEETLSSEKSRYDSAAQAHNSRADANNALPADQRDPGEVASGNAERERLENWQNALQQRIDQYNRQTDDLSARNARLISGAQNLEERATRINAELQRHVFEFGEAYRQLQACQRYAVQIQGLLAQHHADPSSDTADLITRAGSVPDLNSLMEQLKALSNNVFDGTR